MGGRVFNKLLLTAVLKSNKGVLQGGLLLKENPSKTTGHGALHRQVITASSYAGEAHVFLHHHDPHVHRGTMHYHHHHHHHHHPAHIGLICIYRSFCATASRNDDEATDKACGNANGKGAEPAEALAIRLQALLKADTDDEEASKALEALVDQIKAPDDPEGLLMGAACLKLATIHSSENSPNVLKGLSYARKAVKAYEVRGPSLKLATCLYVSALVYITMGDYEKALIELEQSASVMKRMKVTRCDKYCVALKHDVQSITGEACDQFCNAVNFEVQCLFGIAKTHLGMHVEASAHIHKSIKIKQKLLQAGSPDLGVFYLEAAEALRGVKDDEAAKGLCLKALKIFLKCYGPGSPQEAKVRSLLSKIYFDLGKHEDSLRENQSAKYTWKQLMEVEEVNLLNLSSERILSHLQRWNEAMLRLEEVIQATALGNKLHTIALILAAKVHALSNEDESAANYCKRALDALEHHHEPCAQTAGTLALLSKVYEEKKQFDQAALLCKKATEIFDHFRWREALTTAAELEGKTGCLLIHAGKTIEAIPYLESAFSKLKGIPGRDLLYVHFYLGLAYPEVGRLQEALEHFEAAKTALSGSTEVDVTLTVSIYSNLATTYSALNRLDDAIECQKVAADLMKNNEVKDFTLEEVESRLQSYIKEAEVRNEIDG